MSETISIQIKTVLIKDFSISCSTTTRTGFWIFGKLRNFCAVLASRWYNLHICIGLRLMYVFVFGISLDVMLVTIMWGILNKLTPPHDILTTSTNDILTTHTSTNGKLTTLTPQANEEQTRAMIGQVSVDTRWEKNQMIIFWSSSELSASWPHCLSMNTSASTSMTMIINVILSMTTTGKPHCLSTNTSGWSLVNVELILMRRLCWPSLSETSSPLSSSWSSAWPPSPFWSLSSSLSLIAISAGLLTLRTPAAYQKSNFARSWAARCHFINIAIFTKVTFN